MTDTTPETIVLVHGLWMTPRSWEHWVTYYEEQGHTVLTPGYPGFEIEVEGLRENPQAIADLTVPETVDHLAAVVEGVGTPPIIMGHSFGGTLTQLLLARGLGSAGVVMVGASESVRGICIVLLRSRRALRRRRNPTGRRDGPRRGRRLRARAAPAGGAGRAASGWRGSPPSGRRCARAGAARASAPRRRRPGG